ncbi:DUF305 domain-containing protein [Gordonia crocea]|uniref:DUF305 domain-containing protein n=1 Tax=Gordonia crocea TaxID=589162 RepID=UPI00137AEBC1|nr:DUF305 domain-containing protein [Gordonia crocea]
MSARSPRLTRLVVGGVTLAAIAAAFLAGALAGPAFDRRTPAPVLLNTVEEGFLQDMSAHHQQAVSMAQLVDRPGVEDSIRTLARDIRIGQGGELGTMTGWLQMADRPLQNPQPMAWMTRYNASPADHHDHAHGAMPGMATDDEVAQLGSLPPAQAGIRFLRLMQRHHFGGIAMAQDFVGRVPDGLVARLAQSMISTQSKETGLIGTMLTQRGA